MTQLLPKWYATPRRGPKSVQVVFQRFRESPLLPGNTIVPGVPKALVSLKLMAAERLKRSVGAGCTSQRMPRFTVSREVARQSFWLKSPTYLAVRAGRVFWFASTNQPPPPVRIEAPAN